MPVTAAITDCIIGERYWNRAQAHPAQYKYDFFDVHQYFTDFDLSGVDLKVDKHINHSAPFLATLKPLFSGPNAESVITMNGITMLLASEMLYEFATNVEVPKKRKRDDTSAGTPKPLEGVEAIFFTEENLKKAIEEDTDRALRFVSDNCDFLVLCSDNYFRDFEGLANTSGQATGANFSSTFFDFLSVLRARFHMGMWPPLHVAGWCRDKKITNMGLEQLRLPTCYEYLPLAARNGEKQSPTGHCNFLPCFKKCCETLLSEDVLKNSVVLAEKHTLEHIGTLPYLLEHGLVFKPVLGGCSRGVIYMKPHDSQGSVFDAQSSVAAGVTLDSVASVVVAKFDGGVIPYSYLLEHGDAPVQCCVEPAIENEFLRQREYRLFAEPGRVDCMKPLYSVKTTTNLAGELGHDQATTANITSGFYNDAWRKIRCNSYHVKTDTIHNVVFRFDCFTLETFRDNEAPPVGATWVLNEVEVVPEAYPFLSDANTDQEHIFSLAKALKTFILEKPASHPV